MKSLRDYVTLTKPRLNFLAILTTAAGFHMGKTGPWDPSLFFFAVLGAVGVAAGCGALNQVLEKDLDLRMHRTSRRPLPQGRVKPSHAFWFGMGLSLAGLAVLFLKVNELTAFLGFCALVSYLLFYTPLKKVTSLNTVVGAVPGALPPLMGWTAARDAIGPEGWTLFAVLFLWQMPHFLAIGWMYREDYARAGFPMLSVVDPKGGATGTMAVAYSLALLPVSLLPFFFRMTGPVYFWVALVLGLVLLICAVLLARQRGQRQAKGLFWCSITYLPLLFLVMVLDKA
jgi:heme o synthase